MSRPREELEAELLQLREHARQQDQKIHNLRERFARDQETIQELYTTNRALTRSLRELDPATYDQTYHEPRP